MSDNYEARLYACLSSRRWARAVASGASAEEAMDELTDEDWLDAMKAHPRIGERGGEAPESSVREQRAAMRASAATLAALAAENRRYEERFGHVFLIHASGRGGEEILSELRRRMNNDPAAELEEAKRELRKIALMRLRAIVAA
ncbi:MAG TPA: 2-oxo-4-hydroxy-4-carboxy-5-ureidoimidazoline decarboxylase [Candidatus Dormibacteraeota bacterium]|nr:2-oxo-4-hydroxy-4-carboxy-5-ureidoimidazoline decarboxylase [Candidatus Dormibacteraeota bacterium]